METYADSNFHSNNLTMYVMYLQPNKMEFYDAKNDFRQLIHTRRIRNLASLHFSTYLTYSHAVHSKNVQVLCVC